MKFLYCTIILFLFGCQKDGSTPNYDFLGEMEVVRDCTGTYLKYQKSDYRVCNRGKLEQFSSGTRIYASVKKVEKCKDLNYLDCYMYHPHNGLIAVIQIK